MLVKLRFSIITVYHPISFLRPTASMFVKLSSVEGRWCIAAVSFLRTTVSVSVKHMFCSSGVLSRSFVSQNYNKLVNQTQVMFKRYVIPQFNFSELQ